MPQQNPAALEVQIGIKLQRKNMEGIEFVSGYEIRYNIFAW